jgi:hypothetical protein
MRRRFPFLLWRWIAADMVRLISLAAAVLVAVIAMAGTVKPVSDGLLQAENFVKFIFYAIPPMLAYALPFAAGFGATLVYHRLASENESTAAHAGGVSHAALLSPALSIGLALALLLTALNEVLIPDFLLRMQRLVTRDLATWVIQEIDRGRSVNVGGMMLHATSAERVPPAPDSAATDVVYLTRVAAIETDRSLKPVTEVTSERAWILVFPFDEGGDPTSSEAGKTRVVMRLENLVGSRDGQGGGGARKSIDVGWNVGSGFRDNVKFRSHAELKALADHPERINWVDVSRKDLAVTFAEREWAAALQEAVSRGRPLSMRDDQGAPVTINATSMRQDPKDESGRSWILEGNERSPLRMRLARHGVDRTSAPAMITVTASTARMVVDIGPDRLDRSLSTAIEMRDVVVVEEAGGQRSERAMFRAANLTPAEDIVGSMLARSAPELLSEARESAWRSPPSMAFAAAMDDLERSIAKLGREVMAKRHERMAMAASCLVMVLAGAVIALRLSRRLPLTVYMFTFIPAVVCIVTISGGQQLTVQSGVPGLYLMWSGVLGLLVYTLLQFRALARH